MRSFNDSTGTDRLLGRISNGEHSALEELMDSHRRYLRRVVELRMDSDLRRRVDPSDVVQETHLVATQRIDDFLSRRPISFRLWLRGAALERLLMLRRRHIGAQKRSINREVSLSEQSSIMLAQRFVGERPSQVMERGELLEHVRHAVAELGERDREIILLRHVEELTNSEVAELLELDESTASQRYGRAVIRLRDRLVERGFTSAS